MTMTVQEPQNGLGLADRWAELPAGAKGAIVAVPLVGMVAGVAVMRMNAAEPGEHVAASTSQIQSLPAASRTAVINENAAASASTAPSEVAPTGIPDMTATTTAPQPTPTATTALVPTPTNTAPTVTPPSRPLPVPTPPSPQVASPRPVTVNPPAPARSAPAAPRPVITPQRSFTPPRQVTAAPQPRTRTRATRPRTVTVPPRTRTTTTITPLPPGEAPLAVLGRTYVKAGVACPAPGTNGIAKDGMLMVCSKSEGSTLRWRRA